MIPAAIAVVLHNNQVGGNWNRLPISQFSHSYAQIIPLYLIDDYLPQVHAKHEEKSENRSVYREYNREFLLPKGVNPEAIKSSLSKDGVLTVEASLPAIEGQRAIPIGIN